MSDPSHRDETDSVSGVDALDGAATSDLDTLTDIEQASTDVLVPHESVSDEPVPTDPTTPATTPPDGGDGGGDEHGDGDGDGEIPPGRPRRRIDVGLVVACSVIAGGLLLIIWGFTSALTGDDGVDRPPEIEEVSPVENAIQVLQQDTVVVDLQFGFDAVLVIDGIELETSRLGEVSDDIEPGQQQTTDPSTAVFDPGNARITFRPAEGAPIEEFAEGRHTVQVIYWPIDETRETGARSYRWSFDVI